MVKFTRKLLERVATQMNDVMGLDPAIDTTMTDDDTLFDTIVWEARGRGVVKDAVRSDDFVTSNPDKKTFADDVCKFFVDACVWDAANKVVIMAAKVEASAAEAPAEKPVKAAGKKPAKPAEEAAQDDMDAGEAEPQLPLTKEPEQAEPAAEKSGKRKAAKSAAKTTPAAEPTPAEKEEVMATKTAAKKGAAKPAVKASKSTATQKKATVKEKESGPSNKLLVFQAWKHGKGETDIAKLVKHVKGNVTEGTVRGWLSAWGKGKNLPGGVKK